MTRLFYSSTLFLALQFVACDKAALPVDPDRSVAVEEIVVTSQTGVSTMTAGELLQLTANILPANASNKTV